MQENITADISVELRSDRKLMVMVAVIRVKSVLTLVQTQLVGLSGGEVLGSCLSPAPPPLKYIADTLLSVAM